MVQDACLEQAEILGALQGFRNFYPPFISYFQNNEITTQLLNKRLKVPYKWKFHFSRTSLVIIKLTKVMLLDLSNNIIETFQLGGNNELLDLPGFLQKILKKKNYCTYKLRHNIRIINKFVSPNLELK